MWVTYRLALAGYNLTHAEIMASESILVHAPNGICWRAFWLTGDMLARKAF